MNPTLLFYDLETSGLNPRSDRIMQFAAQRTDLDLNPLEDPINLLVKLNDDTLPSPEAILVTGITPQQTQTEGLTETEFTRQATQELFTPGTIAIGYNSVRFDDEFMRHTLWRNFYDPYEWQWKDHRSRWDLLDVVRLTRALRPEGINWPVDKTGKATNSLEKITKLNGISHQSAHDALSDVNALIEVTRLVKTTQPKLYDYLFKMRDKKAVQKLINLENPQPFVYASGRLATEHHKTSVFYPLAPAPNGNILVFDLRHDLNEIQKDEELKARNFFPIVKELRYNHCPAVAPLGVLEQNDAWAKIHLTKAEVEAHLGTLLQNPTFAEQMRTAQEEKSTSYPVAADPESALYDGFLDNPDRVRCEAVRNAKSNDLADFHPDFADPRLPKLLNHYKARNFPQTLTPDEQAEWESYRQHRLAMQTPIFHQSLENAIARGADDFLITELRLWAESISA